MHPLATVGWDGEVERRFAAATADLVGPGGEALEPARVTTVHRGECDVATPGGGRRVTSPPGIATGDWVAVDHSSVVALVPRRTALARQRSDDADEQQVLAADIDLVLLTLPLDRDLNLNRLERELVVAWASGAEPVVVLTKSDRHPDPAAAAAEVTARDPRVRILTTSATTGAGIDELRRLLAPSRTAAMLGASGAGKSTLANALLGAEVQRTTAVRAGDAKGRHTTTTRDLFVIPSGGALIDTPGLRGLLLWSGADGVAAAFPDVEALAEGCRFRDCDHGPEPGCAVVAAVGAGRLPPERAASYRKLRDEAAEGPSRPPPGGRRR